MYKLLVILLALSLLCTLPALADHGTADVIMEGETYHITLDSVGIEDGKLTVVLEGFGEFSNRCRKVTTWPLVHPAFGPKVVAEVPEVTPARYAQLTG